LNLKSALFFYEPDYRHQDNREQSKTKDHRTKKRKAGDPRYRLPLSQLVSPCEGGPSEGGSISASPDFAKGLASHIFMFFSSNLQMRQMVNRRPLATCDSVEKWL